MEEALGWSEEASHWVIAVLNEIEFPDQVEEASSLTQSPRLGVKKPWVGKKRPETWVGQKEHWLEWKKSWVGQKQEIGWSLGLGRIPRLVEKLRLVRVILGWTESTSLSRRSLELERNLQILWRSYAWTWEAREWVKDALGFVKWYWFHVQVDRHGHPIQ